MDYELIDGERKGSSFLYLNQEKFFFRSKSRPGSTYFDCFEDLCNVRVKIDQNNICTVSSSEHFHDHENHQQIFLKWKLINEIKNQVRVSTSTCKDIFDEICAKAEYQTAARQLQFNSLKSTLYRIRKAECPGNPLNASDVEALFENVNTLERFGKTKTANPQLFYQGTISEGDKVAVIFGSPQIIQRLSETNRRYYVDGTFSVVPNQFYQLLIVGIEL